MAVRRVLASLLAIFGILALGPTSATSARYDSVDRTQPAAPAEPAGITQAGQQGHGPRTGYDPEPIDIGEQARRIKPPLDTSGMSPLLGAAATGSYAVGDIRRYVVYNAVAGRVQPADYVVRYKSDLVEVWVQQDLSYRNPDGSLNPVHPDAQDPLKVTQPEIDALAKAAEKIIPVDVEYFGQYKDRAGTSGILLAALNLPADYYAGPPQSVLIVVSNVRDENFFDPINNPSYIGGFFGLAFSSFIDRNVITIDSKRFDQNTGAPNFQNEATIAHEFQHLINADTDPDGEDTWANEGRSEFAEFINGYRSTAERHRTQFSDYPENSLTLWGDQSADPDQNFEILADYQQAYWFQLYLAGRLKEAGIGTTGNQYIKLVSRLTSDPLNSIESTNAMLAAVDAPFTFAQVWNDFRIAMLFGGTSDETTWGSYISTWQGQSGVPVAPLDIGRLRRNLNFEGYDQPGAPPYGSDYIEIGWSPAINAQTTVTFNGNADIRTQWSVVDVDDVGVAPSGAVADKVLYSGHTDFADNFLIFQVAVPSGDQTLSFDTLYNIEQDFDYGIVQVSTDNGATFTTLPIAGTTEAGSQTAVPQILDALPGFTGVSGSSTAPKWLNKTYELSSYAGKTILLAFRHSADQASAGEKAPPPQPGWYLDNIKVGSTELFVNQGSVPANARSIFEVRGVKNTFKVDFVTFADKNGKAVGQTFPVTLDPNGNGTFKLDNPLSQPGFNEAGERVVAVVSVVPPAKNADLVSSPSGYAAYTLTGLPPSIYTSRARAIGTATNTSLSRPQVFPGDTFKMTVTVDNLGRNDDLDTTAASPAYVAVPLPANTTLVPNSLKADVSAANLQQVSDLSTLGADLPAAPGVYWFGTVENTADLSFDLQTAAPLAISSTITPTAHIANAAFNASPSQRFTDLQTPVQVVSPFALSTLEAPATVQIGVPTPFTYTLVNTDDQARDVDFRFTLPDGVALERINISQQDPTEVTTQAATTTIGVTVPSYQETKTVTVITLVLRVELSYTGQQLDPQAVLLQPGSEIPYDALVPVVPGGATVVRNNVYLPLILHSRPPQVGLPPATVPLSPAHEVPPVNSPARGSFIFTFDAATRRLSYTLSVENTSSPVTAAHIHRGVPGTNGPIAYGLYSGGGTFGPGNALTGTITLSESDAALLQAGGGLYVNVHTTTNPGGELRGNL